MKPSWQGMKIDSWKILQWKDASQIPAAVIASLCSIGLPVRIYVNNVLKPELCGTLEGINKLNGQQIVRLKILETTIDKQGKRHHEEKNIIFDETISLELPVFE